MLDYDLRNSSTQEWAKPAEDNDSIKVAYEDRCYYWFSLMTDVQKMMTENEMIVDTAQSMRGSVEKRTYFDNMRCDRSGSQHVAML
jgi:hypothetical protein